MRRGNSTAWPVLRLDLDVSELITGYTVVNHGVRAPRVAVVVPGGEAWQDWVRLGLYGMAGVWGGSGFVLVPHDGGEIAPVLVEMVAAYDPTTSFRWLRRSGSSSM